MRLFAEWITKYLFRAQIVTAALASVPFFGVLSGGVVVLVGLKRGSWDALRVSLGAVALLAGMAWFVSGSVIGTIQSAALIWLPSLALAALLRRTQSLSLCVQVTALLGCVGVALFFLWAGPYEIWGDEFEERLLQRFLEMGVHVSPEENLSSTLRLAPGFIIGGLSLAFMLSLFLGRWWQSLISRPGAFGAEFRRMRMGLVIGIIASVVFVAAGLTHLEIFDNLVIVLLIAFVMQGLSLAHAVIMINGWNTIILVVIYGLLVVLLITPYVLIIPTILAGLGFTDNWLNLKGLARRTKAQ